MLQCTSRSRKGIPTVPHGPVGNVIKKQVSMHSTMYGFEQLARSSRCGIPTVPRNKAAKDSPPPRPPPPLRNSLVMPRSRQQVPLDITNYSSKAEWSTRAARLHKNVKRREGGRQAYTLYLFRIATRCPPIWGGRHWTGDVSRISTTKYLHPVDESKAGKDTLDTSVRNSHGYTTCLHANVEHDELWIQHIAERLSLLLWSFWCLSLRSHFISSHPSGRFTYVAAHAAWGAERCVRWSLHQSALEIFL
ncbi:hypothetical protein F4810DRAFT_33457 [Camillea tinctor]|nr:hypothetical protein F4810DRAFT_33457 [Camillea tinctor]